MTRTKFKLSIAAIAVAAVGFTAMSAADQYEKQLPNAISFGMDHGRPYNGFDYLWIGSFIVAIGLIVAALMLIDNEEE